MVKMLKASDEKLMQDTPITSSKILDEPKNEIIKWEEFKTCTRPRKRKKVISSMETVKKIPNWTGNHLRMTKEEPMKKLCYDLKNQAAYAGKSKLLQ